MDLGVSISAPPWAVTESTVILEIRKSRITLCSDKKIVPGVPGFLNHIYINLRSGFTLVLLVFGAGSFSAVGGVLCPDG